MPNGTHPTRTFAILAPSLASVSDVFTQVNINGRQHAELLAKLQRLRGHIYLEDAAIEPWQLTEDGRHSVVSDSTSWHLLSMEDTEVVGCARLQVYPPTVSFDALTVAESAIATCANWGSVLRLSVTEELRRAQVDQLRFVEAGGWALLPELRCTTEALHIALGSYALGELLGGSLGLSTATVRHHSSSILRRLGGGRLVWNNQTLPPYYDPAYRCEMEVIRFDSRQPNPKYGSVVNQLKEQLSMAPVLCKTRNCEAALNSASVPSNDFWVGNTHGSSSIPDGASEAYSV